MSNDYPFLWWDELGDDELLARLTNHPEVDESTARSLIEERDDNLKARIIITTVLDT